MKIVTLSTYDFLLHPPPCAATPLSINHILSWKSKLKHADVDTTCFFFFQDAKSSLKKHEECLLEASHGISQAFKVELFIKTVNS